MMCTLTNYLHTTLF